MIIYTSKDSFLEIPKGLGNLGGNSGGGSGEDLGPLSGSVVELSAVTESEAVKLADLSASTENLASSVGSMASDLEAVSGSVETLSETVDSQGDSIADLLLDVDGLDTRVSGNTSDIETLSAQTSANTADIAALSSATENVSQTVVSVSAQTTANTANIETLSAATEALSAVTSGLASTVSEMAGKQASIYDWDAFYASDDYSERRAIYSAFTQDFAAGKMVLMKGTTSDGSLIYLHLEKVNTSNPYLATFRYESDGGYTNIGITSSGNESGDYNNSGKLTRNKLAAASASTLANSAYTRADSAYTLASSAYTLADSLTGQTGGGIEKVETLPQNPDNGTLVLLHIPSYTATTFYKTADVNYESGYNLFNYNGEERYSDGYGTRYGVWSANSEYRIRYRRNGDGHLFADVISEGTLTLGSEADGSQTTTIPDRYELWKYENGKWFQLDRERVFQIGVDGTAEELFWRIYSGITDENPYYLTIRYSPDGGALREFKPYDFKYYGMDCQASDSRGSEDGRFGSLKVSSIRLNWDGVNALTSDKWLSPLEEEPAGIGYFNIYSDGTVPQDTNRYDIQGKGVIMIKCGEWNRGWVESLSFTDDYTVLHIKGKIQIDGTEYAGYWTWTEGQGNPWSKVSFTAV